MSTLAVWLPTEPEPEEGEGFGQGDAYCDNVRAPAQEECLWEARHELVGILDGFLRWVHDCGVLPVLYRQTTEPEGKPRRTRARHRDRVAATCSKSDRWGPRHLRFRTRGRRHIICLWGSCCMA